MQSDYSQSQNKSETPAEQNPIEQLAEYIGNEVDLWARLHKKNPESYQDDLEMIFEELVRNGYTVRDAIAHGLHERLRRHRWDLHIGVFYPDDKLISSEFVQATMRAYNRGKRDALQQKPVEYVKPTSEELNRLKSIFELQSENNQLRDQIEKLEQTNNHLRSKLNETRIETKAQS